MRSSGLRALSASENSEMAKEVRRQRQENALKDRWYIANEGGYFFEVTKDVPISKAHLERRGCVFFDNADALARHVFDPQCYESLEHVKDGVHTITQEGDEIVEYCDRLIRHEVEDDINDYLATFVL